MPGTDGIAEALEAAWRSPNPTHAIGRVARDNLSTILAALRSRPDDGRSDRDASDSLMQTFGRLRDCADDVRYARREPQWIAASIRAAAEEVRSAARSLETPVPQQQTEGTGDA